MCTSDATDHLPLSQSFLGCPAEMERRDVAVDTASHQPLWPHGAHASWEQKHHKGEPKETCTAVKKEQVKGGMQEHGGELMFFEAGLGL